MNVEACGITRRERGGVCAARKIQTETRGEKRKSLWLFISLSLSLIFKVGLPPRLLLRDT